MQNKIREGAKRKKEKESMLAVGDPNCQFEKNKKSDKVFVVCCVVRMIPASPLDTRGVKFWAFLDLRGVDT